MRRFPIWLAALGLALSPAIADEMSLQERVQSSRMVIKQFFGDLKGELEKAMKAGGPVHAIGVCNSVAPDIAARHSENAGWRIARTSLKVRNPDNTPDAWERRVLSEFEARKAAGEDIKTMDHTEVVAQDGEKVFRYMKAIPTAAVCLNCHGSVLTPEVEAKLDSVYPQDKARGFNIGDIRGAFTITQPMSGG